MRAKILVYVLSALILTTFHLVGAQKTVRIGFLATSSASFVSTRIETFRQGLRELGYVEGKNIVIEYRFADGKTIGDPSSPESWSV